MSWQDSQGEHVHGDTTSNLYSYPAAQMYTTGLKFGLCF